MDDEKACPKRLAELPEDVREFLADLRPTEINSLRYGLRLISAIMTVATATKWLIITALGILAGIVLLGESMTKIWGWLQRPP